MRRRPFAVRIGRHAGWAMQWQRRRGRATRSLAHTAFSRLNFERAGEGRSEGTGRQAAREGKGRTNSLDGNSLARSPFF